jgi:thiol-disulfide isomerase/thioredoxin
MSTLRLSLVLLIVLILLGLVGCTSTSAYRTTTTTPKMRTVATIGDKPLATVTGEPGGAATSEGEPEPPLERRSRADAAGRISGRVVDDQGEPVAGARVRLAVSSAPGGRMVQATTDRAGGFTLRGLRPGMSYTVVAEWDDGHDVLTGRRTVQAPDSDVRIALGPDETAPQAAGLPAPARVSPVSRSRSRSRRGATEEQEPTAELVESPINVEDLPPAPEAETIAPASRREPRGDLDEAESANLPRARGWRPLERSQAAAAGPQPRPSAGRMARSQPVTDTESASESPAEPALWPGGGRGASAGLPPIEAPVPDDDGPNPLPPALEPGETSLSVPEAAAAADAVKVAADRPAPAPVAAGVAPGTDSAMLLARADEPAALPDLAPGALVAAPPPAAAAPAPLPPATQPPPPSLPPPAPAAPIPASGLGGAVASDDGPAVLPPPVESTEGEFRTPDADPAPRPRPRWRDLAASQTNPPPLERPVRGSPPGQPGPEPDTYCRYDTRRRRIEDFRLPDLQGRLVRFQDFDADLVLLDFWGSWCQPCLRSVPHLIDLQKRYGGKQLQVIGIACEREEAPAAERVARAAGAAKKLGMNYPVLVTSNDASGPLQKALHVQSYPTLILLDRQGRVLWQDQGATRLTMMRLDRMINMMAAKPTDSLRRF